MSQYSNEEYPSLDTPPAGSIRFNTDSAKIEIYNGEQWWNIDGTSPEQETGGTRGIAARGRTPSGTDTIQFFNIDSTGNATDFGNSTYSGDSTRGGQCASRTRGIIGMAEGDETMEFITIASTGNATTFGENTIGGNGAYASSSTRGVSFGGEEPSTYVNVISMITIASTGNATDFGDVSGYSYIYGSGAVSSPTRGVFALGRTSPANANTNNIEFVTISTQGNSADFGDRTYASYAPAGAGNATRGIFFSAGPGGNNTDTIDFVTISTLGNATDFGNLNRTATTFSNSGFAMSSPVRAVYAGGYSGSSPVGTVVNQMEYVQIASTSDSIDFGDLAAVQKNGASISNGHGGLG